MPMDWQKIGRAMQGMGEGFAGRGPQWQAAQAREAEAKAYAERLRQQEEQERRMAALKGAERDAALTLGMMEQKLAGGDVQGFQELAIHHARALQGMNANPLGIRQVIELAQDPLANADRFRNEYAGPMRQYLGIDPLQGEKAENFSAMTQILGDGTTIQAGSQGTYRVTGPDGQEITDPARRASAIQQAKQAEVDQARSIYSARAAGKGEGERGQDTIDLGLRAARQMPILKRTEGLLGELETGGFAGAGLRIKNALGIEGADEAELTTNMARAVLSQLRDIFGAQFTEREGARLERIEAGIGKSTEGNKRIIQNLIQMSNFKAERAIEAAKRNGDYFTVEEIESYMNMDMGPQSGQPSAPTGQIRILGVR